MAEQNSVDSAAAPSDVESVKKLGDAREQLVGELRKGIVGMEHGNSKSGKKGSRFWNRRWIRFPAANPSFSRLLLGQFPHRVDIPAGGFVHFDPVSLLTEGRIIHTSLWWI